MAPLAALLAVALAAPAAAADGDGASRFRAAARAFLGASAQQTAAAAPAADARRDAVVSGCLDVVRDGAARQPVTLGRYYVAWHAVPLDLATAPAVDGLVARLRRVTSPALPLRRARAAFTRRAEDRARIARLLPADLCASLRAWQAQGWRGRATPAPWRRAIERYDRIHERDDPALVRGARLLRRRGASRRVADVFAPGIAQAERPSLAGDPVLQAIEDAGGGPPAGP